MPSLKSQDYALLREEGMKTIRNLASGSWTDHNVHDPGVTMLEAFGYALTECGLRTGMDMQDIIATSAIHQPADFFTAAQVFPSSPIHLEDFRKVLIDHQLIQNAWCFPIQSNPRGQLSVLLEFTDASLNSNSYPLIVTPAGLIQDYNIEIAFPHWDDPDVADMREDVVIQNVTFDGAPADIWTPIEGSKSYFSRSTIVVQPLVGPVVNMQIWIVVRITTEMEDSTLESPLILDDIVTAISAIGDNSPADQTLLKQLNRRVQAAHASMRTIRRYIHAYRNLCEDFTVINASRIQEIGISAIIEIGGGVNIESLLAEIFFGIDNMISGQITFQNLEQAIEEKSSADLLFDGPLLDHGFLESIQDGLSQNKLYTSDILRIIYQMRSTDGTDVLRREDVGTRNIITAREVAISNYLDNRPVTTDARDCLNLVKSQKHIPRLSVSKSHIVVYRNNLEITYDLNRLTELITALKSSVTTRPVAEVYDLAVPKGESFPMEEYYPVQNDLPLVYGTGAAGLPEHASPERVAQARQLKGYLLLYEHMIGGFHAQFEDFNSMFSAKNIGGHTMAQQPLYHISGISNLLTAFDPASMDWNTFTQDSTNGYVEGLQQATESREQFLTRKNKILDHLLASQGEEMIERASLLFRLASEVPNAAALSLPVLLQAQEAQRLNALAALLEDKSNYHCDLPEINKNKAQAFGNVLWRRPDLLEITTANDTFTWTIVIDGVSILQQGVPTDTEVEARRTAEQALKMATSATNYSIRNEGGGIRRLELPNPLLVTPIAESLLTYNSNAAAQTGISDTVAMFLDVWTKYSLTSLECRLYHLLGIAPKERRQLVRAPNEFIEIFDEVDADPFIEKRFRLWELPGFTGAELIASSGNYPGPTDQQAMVDARVAVQDLINHGIHAANYISEDNGGNTFSVALTMPDGTVFARSPQVFNGESAAQTGIKLIADHLFNLYSSEGFYCIEHHLLFPESGGVELSNAASEPYSFQMTFILPSGFARDFSIANDPPTASQPGLYQNSEFRLYAETQIRKHCPAHILPRILWIDKALPGSVFTPPDPCFDSFETAYRDWLILYLADQHDELVIAPLRNALTTSINALYAEYYI